MSSAQPASSRLSFRSRLAIYSSGAAAPAYSQRAAAVPALLAGRMEEFSLRNFIQDLLVECRTQFDTEDSVEERIRIVCSSEKSRGVGELVHQEDAWPRKNEELSRRNREDGNTAYQEEKSENI